MLTLSLLLNLQTTRISLQPVTAFAVCIFSRSTNQEVVAWHQQVLTEKLIAGCSNARWMSCVHCCMYTVLEYLASVTGQSSRQRLYCERRSSRHSVCLFVTLYY